jgi:hypothetical protein
MAYIGCARWENVLSASGSEDMFYTRNLVTQKIVPRIFKLW